jgi:hypothetical protein
MAVMQAVKKVLQRDLDITRVISFAAILPPCMGGWVDVRGADETNSGHPVDTQ